MEQLLAGGIDVITTLTVQSIESLADPVLAIVGALPDGSVPDRFLATVEQIELVDITPQAIRRRIAHGNVFPAGALGPRDADLFNTDAFARLRALTIGWMADRVAPDRSADPEVQERIVVAVTDAASSVAVLRRAARLAHRSRGRLIGVHVRRGRPDPAATQQRRSRVEALGGRYHEVTGSDVARALASFAMAEQATQLVLGAPAAPRLAGWPGRSVVDRLVRLVGDCDVHVVGEADPALDGRRRTRPRATSRRTVFGLAGAALVLAVVTAAMVAVRDHLSVAAASAVYLFVVVGVTAAAGAVPGVLAALVAPALADWFVIAPYETFRIGQSDHVVELLLFVTTSLLVSVFVSIAQRRSAEARRAWREATVLAELHRAGGPAALDTIVSLLRSSFGLDGVAVVRPGDTVPVTATGDDVPFPVAASDVTYPLGEGTILATRGPAVSADDHRVLRAFTAQLSGAIEQERLHRVAQEADTLARADELRTAILRAVSHDLRSPLAAIKASVSSLRQRDVEWPVEARDGFLADIENETDRLTAIVTNLLDLSRLEAGVLHPRRQPVAMDELAPQVLRGLGDTSDRVRVEVPTDLPELDADPALVERVLANLVDNGLRCAPDPTPVVVRAHASNGEVQVHVIDHGPGIPPARRAVALQPFHRLDDTGTGRGLGLGLAIADRLTAAMRGRLELRDTPGGGLTAVVTYPACEAA